MAPDSTWITAPPRLSDHLRDIRTQRQVVNGQGCSEPAILLALAWVAFGGVGGLEPIERLGDVLEGVLAVIAKRWANLYCRDQTPLSGRYGQQQGYQGAAGLSKSRGFPRQVVIDHPRRMADHVVQRLLVDQLQKPSSFRTVCAARLSIGNVGAFDILDAGSSRVPKCRNRITRSQAMSIEENLKKIPKWASQTASETLSGFLSVPRTRVDANLKIRGLHSLDFLLIDEDPVHRAKLAMDITGKFIQYSRNKRLVSHISSMSILDDLCKSIYFRDLLSDSSSCNPKLHGDTSIEHLMNLMSIEQMVYKKRPPMKESIKFMVDNHAENGSEVSKRIVIQSLSRSLIYNTGYKYLSEGIDPQDVFCKLAPVADDLLSLVEMSESAREVVKRQSFINLFCYKPDGLLFMNTVPEELQGVPDYSGMQNRDELKGFDATIAGPLHIFFSDESMQLGSLPKAVGYFESNGHLINIETALMGCLSKDISIGYLATRDEDSLNYIQSGITGNGRHVSITIALSVTLMKPDVLVKMNDDAKLAVIGHALMYIGKQYKNNPKEPNLSGCKLSIAHVVKASPNIIPKVIDMLYDNGLLIPRMYEWFGFGHKEMKFVGKRADAFKATMLEQDLGM